MSRPQPTTAAPPRARHRLARRVREALAGRPGAEDAAPRVIRLEERLDPTDPTDPLAWLGAQAQTPRLFWSGRDDERAVAAVGAADRLPAGESDDYGALRQRLAPLRTTADPDVRYYSALRFDPARAADPEWAAFAAGRVLLPRFELCARGQTTVLACNLVLPRDIGSSRDIAARTERLAPGDEPRGAELPGPATRTDRPDAAGWRRGVEHALSAVRDGRLDKVVLARKTDLEFAADIDPVALMRRLRGATPHCFHFLVQPSPDAALIGASPERLFRRDGRDLRSEAVAGTRGRGESRRADERLRDELFASDKDRREHAYVRRSIRDRLAPLCDALDADTSPSEMALARGRHLVSGVRGRLAEGVGDIDLLRALHPTPAVGGTPRDAALAAIRELEPFDRGLYAGPVGWIGRDAAEFAVAIRSGLVRAGRLALYSGAGIVEGSRADAEWTEIEQKITDFTEVLGR